MTKFNYGQAKQQLDDILSWFESPDIDFEQADIKYKQAKEIIKEIESYLNNKEAEIKLKNIK